MFRDSISKILKKLSIYDFIVKFFDVYIQQFLGNILGMPGAARRFTKLKDIVKCNVNKAKAAKDSFKIAKSEFKDRINNTEKIIEDVPTNVGSVVGAMKHIVSGVSNPFSNKKPKFLKGDDIKESSSTPATPSSSPKSTPEKQLGEETRENREQEVAAMAPQPSERKKINEN